MGGNLATAVWEEQLRGAILLGNADNTTPLLAYVKLKSKSQACLQQAIAMSMRLWRNRAAPWWRYENTKNNRADFWSRDDFFEIATNIFEPEIVDTTHIVLKDLWKY